MATRLPSFARTVFRLMYLTAPAFFASRREASLTRDAVAAHVEGTHGELGTRLADGLRRDDTDGFAHLNHLARAKVTAVAQLADPALRLAGEDRTNLDLLDAGGLDVGRLRLVDLFVRVNDDLAIDVLELLQRDAADDAVAQRLDDLTGFDDRVDVDALDRPAIGLGDDHILRHIDQAAGEVTPSRPS